MAKKFEVDGKARILNALAQSLARLGVGPSMFHVLTTTGRKSGKPRRIPVDVLQVKDQRWLVSPYGESGWVKNVRAGGEVWLRRGRREEAVRLQEVDAETAAPILKEYIRNVPITRPYFDVSVDSPHEAFVAEAPRHPAFRILGKGSA